MPLATFRGSDGLKMVMSNAAWRIGSRVSSPSAWSFLLLCRCMHPRSVRPTLLLYNLRPPLKPLYSP
ncbi:hypothetical protein V6N13_043557 [Hibiscus sabdariffa]